MRIYWLQRLKENKAISSFDIIIFLRQFATLISAGIPVTQSCDILGNCQSKNKLQELIFKIQSEIATGKTLHDSLKNHSLYFNELTCQLVRIGEQTGKLDSLLSLAANYHEKNYALKRNIKQALFYPCIVTIIAALVAVCMLIFVIPQFAELFRDTQSELPFLTICIFHLSIFLRQHLWIFFIVINLYIFLYFFHQKSNKKYMPAHLIEHLPFLQPFIRKIKLVKFARHLAIALSAGIPITNALTLTVDTADSTEFNIAIRQLSIKLKSGFPLHHAMSTLPVFPHLMVQMVKVGEETGILEDMINKFADFMEADITQLIDHLNLLLEPLIMAILGVLIGGLVIGMYLPIFKLGNTV